MKTNIFLIGPMGAGKSTIGRLLSQELHYKFLDADRFLEERYGMSIRAIFAQHGEAFFRECENQVLDELTQRSALVLATGGGVVLRPDNRTHLKTRGTVVYLRASLPVQWQRLQYDQERPLLQVADPKAELAKIAQIRNPLYAITAHITIDTDCRSPHLVVRKIMNSLKNLASF
jgi:shikimate kinase